MRRVARRRRPLTVARAEGNAVLREWCLAARGRVLSVGSATDQDKEGRRYRDYFLNAASYTTSDYSSDAPCDLHLDIRAMREVEDGTYDAVFCHSVLEHVDDLWSALRECARVLASGGTYLVGVPFRYGIHRAPNDYWRFTEYGVRYMLGAVGLRVEEIVPVDEQGDVRHPAMYWARARKP